MHKYTDLSKKLGRGSFASVKLVQRNSDKKLLAMKIIDLPNEEAARSAYNESSFLEKLQHPNIVKFYETFVEKGSLYVIMEYCEQGDLKKKVKEARDREEYFSEEQVLEWFTQVCLAVKHMHDSHVIHRDIKIHNTFLTSSGLIKLGDFGISKQLESTIDMGKTCLGTPFYVSPEMLSYSISSCKSDIWMLGCLLYELCTLEKPFSGDNIPTVIRKILFEGYPQIPGHYSGFTSSLISKLLEKDQEKRPSIETILEMPVIQREVEKLRVKYPEAYGFPSRLKTDPHTEDSQVETLFLAKRCASDIYCSQTSRKIDTESRGNSHNLRATWGICKSSEDCLTPQREGLLTKKVIEKPVIIITKESVKVPVPQRKANNIRTLVERKKAMLSPLSAEKLTNSSLSTQVPNRSFSSAFSSYFQGQNNPDNSESSIIRPIRVSNSQLETNESMEIESKVCDRLDTREDDMSIWDHPLEDTLNEEKTDAGRKNINLFIRIPPPCEQGNSLAQISRDKACGSKGNSLRGSGATSKKQVTFSDYLFDEKGPGSPSRPFWVSQFLKKKLGEKKFEQARELVEASPNPARLLKENPEKVLEVIGENNRDCLVMLSFLVSHNKEFLTPRGESKRSVDRSSCYLKSSGGTKRNMMDFKYPVGVSNRFLKDLYPCVTEPDFLLQGASSQRRIGEYF